MEDFLQLVVKCFPIATFIVFITSCTSKPQKTETISSSQSVTESSEESEKEAIIIETKNPLMLDDVISEDRNVACGNQKDSSKSAETAEKKKEESKAEQEFILDETNPHFAFLLAGENRDQAQTFLHGKIAYEHSNAFQWAMKKRLAFDEGCWKHLSRRIGAIRAEGFEVRVNTRQARENKQNADRETKIDAVFNKYARGKKKSGE